MREPAFDPQKVYRYDSGKDLFFIDIDLDFYREIYNAWDFSPQINRDLDEDLLEYLENCCAEIPPRHAICISLNLPEAVYAPEREARSREGFTNFFTYLVRRERSRSKNFYQKIAFFIALGSLLLVLASVMQHQLNSFLHTDILSEGIVVGGWVCFWEVFSILFFELAEHRKKIRTFRRLLNAEIIFRYRKTLSSEPHG